MPLNFSSSFAFVIGKRNLLNFELQIIVVKEFFKMPENEQNIRKRNSSKSFQESIKYLEESQWNKLKEVIDNTRDRLLIKLLYSTGCKAGFGRGSYLFNY
jgi:site-specific recombinase XerD